jgi:dTMP kinase
VISDRYLDSSVAYQGAARGLGEDRIAELSLWATEGLVPDLTVVLDVAPSVGLGRAGDANRMEAEPEDFHRGVRESFLRRVDLAPERYLVVAAEQAVEDVAAVVLAAVIERLPPERLAADRLPPDRLVPDRLAPGFLRQGHLPPRGSGGKAPEGSEASGGGGPA